MYMTQSTITAQALAKIYEQKQLPKIDNSYLLHCALGELYGDYSPRPWVLQSTTEDTYTVLGYADADAETLRQNAAINAQPAIAEGHEVHAKEMPETLPEGLQLEFQLEACPIIRKASAGSVETPDGTRDWHKGQEVDVFLDRAWHTNDSISREGVYTDWAEGEIEGARIDAIQLLSYSFATWVRRRGSDYTDIDRPQAYFSGTCTVTDPEVFAKTLRRGIGQHRTFGMGMLKIRAA